MPTAEERLAAQGYELPALLELPPGVTLPFPWVRVIGSRAIFSGHGPTNADGSLAQPLGKVGAEVSEEQAYVAARLTAESSSPEIATGVTPAFRSCGGALWWSTACNPG